MTKMSFFEEKQAAAVLKHGILGRYMRTFVSKTGVKSTGNRVVYLDGYAGPGLYSDGQVGSPMLAVTTANALAGLRNVYGIYIEKDQATAGELQGNLASTGHQHVVLCGDVGMCLRNALSQVGDDAPLFAFFDPFGLPVSMDSIAGVMARAGMVKGRRTGPVTEVMVTLSYPGIRRNAGHLTSYSTNERYRKTRASKLVALDAVFGGQWWQEIWATGEEDREAAIADKYTRKLAERMQAIGWYRVPVAKKWGGRPVYDLLFFTQYPREGVWHFNECVSLALESYRECCTRGQLDLEPLEQREASWVEQIKENIVRLLAEVGGFRVDSYFESVFRATLGYARGKHLRAALKQLHDVGIIRHDGKGDLVDAYVEGV